jgi:uncharacterized protein YecT (DUF1311 family)
MVKNKTLGYNEEEVAIKQSQRNKLKRRDKKIAKKKTGMKVDDSAKKLARIKLAKLTETRTDNIWPGIGMPRL